jgi:hypothetical protein
MADNQPHSLSCALRNFVVTLSPSAGGATVRSDRPDRGSRVAHPAMGALTVTPPRSALYPNSRGHRKVPVFLCAHPAPRSGSRQLICQIRTYMYILVKCLAASAPQDQGSHWTSRSRATSSTSVRRIEVLRRNESSRTRSGLLSMTGLMRSQS